ncbi:hypothetical protein [Pseudoalteromonas piscicida]|uniref:Uncharacterized protein n=1 Tax=Pseudoalteromonas piscicida TaxID=43662 RepID=A0A2A5JT87_PSEO7|nr:hypothetical protein [Pseudoalteromonas piscicida]PCK32684.1 hypothetical protein CEX98_05535 [Pseudoalteromonas piscicida]
MKTLIAKYLLCLLALYLLVFALCQEYKRWETAQLCSQKCAHLNSASQVRVHTKLSGAICYCVKEAPTHIVIVEP